MRGRWPAMVRLAYGLTGDLGHAEDVAQAAFARVYAAWGRLARAGHPDAYLRQVVVNENRRRFRKQRVPEDLPGDLPDPGLTDHAHDSDERAVLLAALGRLGPRQRAVVDVQYVVLTLTGSQQLKLIPVTYGGHRYIAYAAPAAMRVTMATAYLSNGQELAAIPFNPPGFAIPEFVTWQGPGLHEAQSVTAVVASGRTGGRSWSVTASKCRVPPSQ
jgi:RNA polymerase sigma factor (sigma-70 family)